MTCGHEPCTCEVARQGDHCGPTCRLGIGTGDEPCKCGHAGCSATEGEGEPAV